jgi:hypothetical protein
MIGKRSDALGTPTAHNTLAITTHNNLMAWLSHIIVCIKVHLGMTNISLKTSS